MKAVSPVIPGNEADEIKVAEHQEEYNTLPVLYSDDGQQCTSRWELSEEEVAEIIRSRSIFLTMLTFGQPLQPVRLEVVPALMDVAPIIVPPHMPMHCRRCGSQFDGCDCPDAEHAAQYPETSSVQACRFCHPSYDWSGDHALHNDLRRAAKERYGLDLTTGEVSGIADAAFLDYCRNPDKHITKCVDDAVERCVRRWERNGS